jgi:hypothetical protein
MADDPWQYPAGWWLHAQDAARQHAAYAGAYVEQRSREAYHHAWSEIGRWMQRVIQVVQGTANEARKTAAGAREVAVDAKATSTAASDVAADALAAADRAFDVADGARAASDRAQDVADAARSTAQQSSEAAEAARDAVEDLRHDVALLRREMEDLRRDLRRDMEGAFREATDRALLQLIREQVHGAFEREERKVMKLLAEKLNEWTLSQEDAMSTVASEVTDMVMALVDKMAAQTAEDVVRSSLKQTLPACVRAEVARALRADTGT